MTQPAKISINGQEYNIADLSDAAKAQLQSLQFAKAEVQRLQAQIAIAKTAEASYQRALVDNLPK
ncbi:MAG: DUF6447 family protein [Pseudomonadales bacterium]|uniref:Uncharacterized protein n=1 Tax=Oleiphilus messinensis TaxID=141451 RepID=A0A1Y0I459_9GAMM|nr:DUF6447 family protein [Oleiphilus messinensis]ARU55020.1 hypothetical protein OLMES_0933 [Oleiphilus messinensis]MCG8609804.1 DUF6447 family protein [Pseudomonadales bacterium]